MYLTSLVDIEGKFHCMTDLQFSVLDSTQEINLLIILM